MGLGNTLNKNTHHENKGLNVYVSIDVTVRHGFDAGYSSSTKKCIKGKRYISRAGLIKAIVH